VQDGPGTGPPGSGAAGPSRRSSAERPRTRAIASSPGRLTYQPQCWAAAEGVRPRTASRTISDPGGSATGSRIDPMLADDTDLIKRSTPGVVCLLGDAGGELRKPARRKPTRPSLIPPVLPIRKPPLSAFLKKCPYRPTSGHRSTPGGTGRPTVTGNHEIGSLRPRSPLSDAGAGERVNRSGRSDTRCRNPSTHPPGGTADLLCPPVRLVESLGREARSRVRVRAPLLVAGRGTFVEDRHGHEPGSPRTAGSCVPSRPPRARGGASTAVHRPGRGIPRASSSPRILSC
jgi:hypothetical protein